METIYSNKFPGVEYTICDPSEIDIDATDLAVDKYIDYQIDLLFWELPLRLQEYDNITERLCIQIWNQLETNGYTDLIVWK